MQDIRVNAVPATVTRTLPSAGEILMGWSDQDSFILANLLIQRHMDLTWPLAHLHPGAIADNRRQPSGHLRLSPEFGANVCRRPTEHPELRPRRQLHCNKSESTPIKAR